MTRYPRPGLYNIAMKHKFSVDSDNRLLIQPYGAKKYIKVKGHFALDKNQLIYFINEPQEWRLIYGLPQKIRFRGSWRITSNYDLELVLDRGRFQQGRDRLVLNSRIIAVEEGSLVFQLITRKLTLDSPCSGYELHSLQLLKLEGNWQANAYNQLTFLVRQQKQPDILTFQAAWQLNNNQQISYAYERTDLKTKAKIRNILVFKGYWQITAQDRLAYILSGSGSSCFEFKAQLESDSLYPAQGAIKYRIGIGAKKAGKAPTRIFTLFGEWKFNRDLGLLFEMDYGQEGLRAIEFTAEVSATAKDKFLFEIKDPQGQPLGLSLTFTHRFMKQSDAEAFLRLKTILKKENRVEAGVHIPF